MAELYQSGKTLEEVGKEFGLTRQGVRERFIKAGIARRSKDKFPDIDKTRLETLYLGNKLPVSDIADLFLVSEGVIMRALKFHQIPKRRRISNGGYIVNFLRSLKIGEKDTIEPRKSSEYASLHTAARLVGIKISVKKLEERRYEVTRLE
jgi:hypothetical protein